MAKIKISELAKELACESKDLLGYLQEKGIETAKRSTSSIEDAEPKPVHCKRQHPPRVFRTAENSYIPRVAVV